MKKFKALQHKREFIRDKIVVGIDPAKRKLQAAVLDPQGILLGTPFSFNANYQGFTITIWDKLKQRVENYNRGNIVFALETSCNLWQLIGYYLCSCKYKVVLVSPLTTKHSRPFISHDFSRTDPKDALLIASNARDGYFDFYRKFPPHSKALHQLSITYDKLRKNYVQNRLRLRAFLEQVFPELLTVLKLDSDTAIYLLKRYYLPRHFIEMDIEKEAIAIEKVSQKQHGKNTLQKLKELAQHSIGIAKQEEELTTSGIVVGCWIRMIETIQQQMKLVMDELISLAKETPYYKSISSLKGVSDKLTSLFIAELGDIAIFSHYKQIEKYAGLNLRQSQSGQFTGARHISRLGNKRLRWILFKMGEETARYIPEVRIKFLKRQLKHKRYRKNITASIPQLLKLIMAISRDGRVYEYNPESLEALQDLEREYEKRKLSSKGGLQAA